MKTGNPKESAGKHKTTFSLKKKGTEKKPHPVKIDLLVTNGWNWNIPNLKVLLPPMVAKESTSNAYTVLVWILTRKDVIRWGIVWILTRKDVIRWGIVWILTRKDVIRWGIVFRSHRVEKTILKSARFVTNWFNV